MQEVIDYWNHGRRVPTDEDFFSTSMAKLNIYLGTQTKAAGKLEELSRGILRG